MGIRVLVVDDHPDVADSTALLLRLLGYVSRACYSGDECLACVEQFGPQVILLDLMMPKLDGFDTCDRIRQVPGFRDVPIIALSALDTTLVEVRAANSRFACRLGKPADAQLVKAAI